MIRKIIKIDTEKCNGCALCVDACHERAIVLKDGKATLLRDDYCDGLGDCLPACPTGAISFEMREALPYDEEAVQANIQAGQAEPSAGGCPGSMARSLAPLATSGGAANLASAAPFEPLSALRQWPVQLKLVPGNAVYFDNADILIAADCCAYAYGNFHDAFIRGRVTLIGCPKLDECDYAEKLGLIFKENNIRSVTLTRMSVPCCGGMSSAVERAIKASGKNIPLKIVTISSEGNIVGVS